MGSWFDCQDCVFASNSPKQATKHVEDTGHSVKEEED